MRDGLKVGRVDTCLESASVVKLAGIVARCNTVGHPMSAVSPALPVDLAVAESVAGASPLPAAVLSNDVLPTEPILERFVQEWTDAGGVAMTPVALVVRAAVAVSE